MSHINRSVPMSVVTLATLSQNHLMAAKLPPASRKITQSTQATSQSMRCRLLAQARAVSTIIVMALVFIPARWAGNLRKPCPKPSGTTADPDWGPTRPGAPNPPAGRIDRQPTVR